MPARGVIMSRDMYRKLLISIVLASLVVPLAGADSMAGLAGPAGMIQPVDRVVVTKSTRKMELYREGSLIASYKVSLGLVPTGQKQREGDYRTPEGRYRLTRRNAQSDFFLAVQVSYPEATDIAIARRNGWAPGGSIMVHGLPNERPNWGEEHWMYNWTNGCIAVTNREMDEIWASTELGTPIEIRP